MHDYIKNKQPSDETLKQGRNWSQLLILDEDEEHMTSSKTNFPGIKISDKIRSHLKDSYFKIKINENWRHLHK